MVAPVDVIFSKRDQKDRALTKVLATIGLEFDQQDSWAIKHALESSKALVSGRSLDDAAPRTVKRTRLRRLQSVLRQNFQFVHHFDLSQYMRDYREHCVASARYDVGTESYQYSLLHTRKELRKQGIIICGKPDFETYDWRRCEHREVGEALARIDPVCKRIRPLKQSTRERKYSSPAQRSQRPAWFPANEPPRQDSDKDLFDAQASSNKSTIAAGSPLSELSIDECCPAGKSFVQYLSTDIRRDFSMRNVKIKYTPRSYCNKSEIIDRCLDVSPIDLDRHKNFEKILSSDQRLSIYQSKKIAKTGQESEYTCACPYRNYYARTPYCNVTRSYAATTVNQHRLYGYSQAGDTRDASPPSSSVNAELTAIDDNRDSDHSCNSGVQMGAGSTRVAGPVTSLDSTPSEVYQRASRFAVPLRRTQLHSTASKLNGQSSVFPRIVSGSRVADAKAHAIPVDISKCEFVSFG